MNLTDNPQLSYSEILRTDLDEIIQNNYEFIQYLSGKRILILGGTGFVGKWLVASLIHSQMELPLEFEITIVTRSTEKSKKMLRVSSDFGIHFVEHDLSKSALHNMGKFDVLIHGATPSVRSTGAFNLKEVVRTSNNATQSILGATQKGSRVINLSSGAVMGDMRTKSGLVEECGSFGAPKNEYAVAKIAIEKELEEQAKARELILSHARLFAFSGPHISLVDHFAVGNFMKNTLEETGIVVNGNPETQRSYMYPTDLVASIIRLAPRVDISHINVGSPQRMTIKEVAESFARLGGNLPIRYKGKSEPINSYLPEVRLLPESLKISKFIDLETGIKRWRKWLSIRT